MGSLLNNGMINILNIDRNSLGNSADGKYCYPLYGNNNIIFRGNEFDWGDSKFEKGNLIAMGSDGKPRLAEKGDKNPYIVIWGSERQDAQMVNTVVDGRESVCTNIFKAGIKATLKPGDKLCAVGGLLTTVADAGAGAVEVFEVENANYALSSAIPGGSDAYNVVIIKKI